MVSKLMVAEAERGKLMVVEAERGKLMVVEAERNKLGEITTGQDFVWIALISLMVRLVYIWSMVTNNVKIHFKVTLNIILML